MRRYQKFLVFWLVNSAILYVANLFLPGYYTLGNSILATYQAMVLSGFYWSVVLWYTEPTLKDLEVPMKNTTSMMLTYLAVNFATVWMLARISFLTGLGIANFWYVAVLAVVGNLVQYAARQYMDKQSLSPNKFVDKKK